MLKTGHQGAALLLYAPVGLYLLARDPFLAVAGVVGTVALSMLPDVDVHVPFVKHRGVTHTLGFLVAVTGGLAVVGSTFGPEVGVDAPTAALLGAVVGFTSVGSHLLADALTPSGVPLLWPLSSYRFSLGLAKADNPVANRALFLTGVCAAGWVAHASGLV